ncbi:MAG: hypothetical protein MJ239_01985 [Bacilli bacterium]|nr:hypothetical protein [Bacilli bacterium]
MKNKTILLLSALTLTGLLASCGGNGTSSSKSQTIELVDNRQEIYTTVIGEMNHGVFESYDEDKDYKSLYEAVQACLENGEAGSYVYRKGGDAKKPAFVKQQRSDDYWYYYKDGNVAEGYAPYMVGDVDWYRGQNYTRIQSSGGYAHATYQPYALKGHEGKSTQSWNRLPLLDGAVRYNPHAFTGIQDTTYTFNLSKAKIRPSYSKDQKAIPMVGLSTTDSYNWSNQGIYMDTVNGNWYYFYGETQSDSKSLEYEEELIMTSSWDQAAQEFTPTNDVRMTLNMYQDEEEDFVSNKLKIEILENGNVIKTIDKEYELNTMTMRGTHRAQIAIDLVPTDEDNEEASMTPDYMCGAYFKNAIVAEGKGSVREGLTDEEYMGDTDMCCEPGHTYDLTYAKGGYSNDSDTEVILDNCTAISYSDANAGCDTWNISFEQVAPTVDRTETIASVETKIEAIPDGADLDDPKAAAAYLAWEKLSYDQQLIITEVDHITKLKDIIGD